MGWKEQQSGYHGGNAPHPNDTAGTQSYWQGQGQRNAESTAARASSSSLPDWSTPPASSNTSTVGAGSGGWIFAPYKLIVKAGLIGALVGILPFFFRGPFYHSWYMDKVVSSMAIFFGGIAWAMNEFRLGRYFRTVQMGVGGILIAQIVWIGTGRWFWQIWLALLGQKLGFKVH